MTKPDQKLIEWAQYLAKSVMLDAETDDQIHVTRIRARLMLYAQSVISSETVNEWPAVLEDEKLQCRARIMHTLFGPLISHLCAIKGKVAGLDTVGHKQYEVIQDLDTLINLLSDMMGRDMIRVLEPSHQLFLDVP